MDMLYFPIIDKVAVLSIDRSPEVTSSVGERQPHAPSRAVVMAHRVRVAPLQALSASVIRLPALHAFVTRAAAKNAYRPTSGRSDTVLAFLRTGPAVRTPGLIRDMELAIRREEATAALKKLREHFISSRRYPLLPVHLRCSPSSSQWLSPAFDQDVCWLEFCSNRHEDPLFSDAQALLGRSNTAFTGVSGLQETLTASVSSTLGGYSFAR